MSHNLSKMIWTGIVGAALALPAAAQVPLPPRPHLEIHIGRSAPPPVRFERRSPRPDRYSVWIRGFWDWQGDQWIWVPGRWDRPVRRHARWIGPRYHREFGAWRYEPGHWSTERIVEGEDYRRWREEHHGRRDRDRDDHDRDREQQR